MRHGAYGLPNLRRFRLLKLAQISRISQFLVTSLQDCFALVAKTMSILTTESDIAFMVEASGSYWIRY
jgi:hypothetical protein